VSSQTDHLTCTGITIAAMRGEACHEQGWFKLELRDKQSQIESAPHFLAELNLEFWRSDSSLDASW